MELDQVNQDVQMSYNSFVEEAPSSGKSLKKRRSQKDTNELDQKLYKMGDSQVIDVEYPQELESDLVCAIFELGLRHSSPKVLMGLMPEHSGLSSEHIKSHLQKYRIHHERSKEEFLQFYNEHVKEMFTAWERKKGWETCQNLQDVDNIHTDDTTKDAGSHSTYQKDFADFKIGDSLSMKMNLCHQAETILSEWRTNKNELPEHTPVSTILSPMMRPTEYQIRGLPVSI